MFRDISVFQSCVYKIILVMMIFFSSLTLLALRQGPQLVPPVSKETVHLGQGTSAPQLLAHLSPVNILSPVRQTPGGKN